MNKEKNIKIISTELNLSVKQVLAAVNLLEDDATIPFIARYRKEVTGGLDEVALIAIRDRLEKLTELDKRREAIIKSLTDQEKLTPELEKAVNEAETMARLEDVYLPYKPKRRTRGTIAKEKGLEPLADSIFNNDIEDITAAASEFLDEEKQVNTVEDALSGARDIMAEWINENSDARDEIRTLFNSKGLMSSSVVKGKDKEGAKYRDYFEWNEPVTTAPSHRILALLRGADEGFLSIHFMPDEADALELLRKRFVHNKGQASEQITKAVEDSYKRLISSSMENELRTTLKKRADEEAITVFAENVRELLLSPPMGQKATLAVDPGLRTGCKVVCLSPQGQLLQYDTIYPLEPQKKTEEAAEKIKNLCNKYSIKAIAIGNGTGGREALEFVKSIGLEDVIITMVNESGASVYSASTVARKEFPDHDVTVRGSVSIGRRLMDPLAELVKIDPGSIGVGQYQHDVDQKELKRSLDDTVISCVNSVGVEVNTASGELLKYVAGLSGKMADSIVGYRNTTGPFRTRHDILQVSGMGPRSFEQSAGFLRIRDGENPLDRSAVHPESYHIVEQMAQDLGCTVTDLMEKAEMREKIDLKKYVSETTGMETLKDIYNELAKPGRDPRKEFELFTFKDGVNKMSDLEPGMMLPGVITNVTAFGAFVDIGVHQDGLVHISELADTYVKNPADAVKVNQKVTVRILEVDIERKRISLSMKSTSTGEKSVKSVKTEKKKVSKKKVEKKNQEKKKFDKKINQKKDDGPASPFAGLKDML